MKAKNFLFAGLASIILAACSEQIVEDDMLTNRSGLKVEVTDEFASAATRADYSGFPATTFETDDAIGVYAFDGSSYVASNIRFVKQSDGSWLPDNDIPYNEDYTYYAYFPYRATTYTPSTSGTVDEVDTKFGSFISDASNYFWKADQSSKANYTYSNLMVAKGTVTDVDEEGGTATVKFTMAHKRGLALIGDALNQWYYTDAAGTKYTATPVFEGSYRPYSLGGELHYLIKPDVTTSVFGNSLNLPAGEYKRSPIKLTGTPTYKYSTLAYPGASWSSESTSIPSWLTVETEEEEGKPTEFLITTTSTNSAAVNNFIRNYMIREVPADATLKAASPLSNVDLSMVDNAGTARASRTTANCYLVHAPGTYKIPLVYGNAIKNGETNRLAYQSYYPSVANNRANLVNHADVNITAPWITSSGDGANAGMGYDVDGASLVWQDVENMITDIEISADGHYLTFTVDEDNIAEGNAVIAVKSGNTVVWSWHVWVTTQTLNDLTTIRYSSSADYRNYQVAPVNVGFVNGRVNPKGKIYAGPLCKIKATANNTTVLIQVQAKNYETVQSSSDFNYYPCPVYQWGRKDAECAKAAYYGNGTWKEKPDLVSGAYSIGTTIQNPDKHYYNSSTDGPYNENYYNYWDLNRISSNYVPAPTKTIYDPCPPGFCVPPSYLFLIMANNSTSRSDNNWDNTNKLKTWVQATYSSITIGSDLVFPGAILYLTTNAGSTSMSSGNGGYTWSSDYINNSKKAKYFSYNSTYWLNGMYGDSPSKAFPIRPVAEDESQTTTEGITISDWD